MQPTHGNPALEKDAKRPLVKNRTWLVVVVLLVFAAIVAVIILAQSPPTGRLPTAPLTP
jgi:hypothetical protein